MKIFNFRSKSNCYKVETEVSYAQDIVAVQNEFGLESANDAIRLIFEIGIEATRKKIVRSVKERNSRKTTKKETETPIQEVEEPKENIPETMIEATDKEIVVDDNERESDSLSSIHRGKRIPHGFVTVSMKNNTSKCITFPAAMATKIHNAGYKVFSISKDDRDGQVYIKFARKAFKGSKKLFFYQNNKLCRLVDRELANLFTNIEDAAHVKLGKARRGKNGDTIRIKLLTNEAQQ